MLFDLVRAAPSTFFDSPNSDTLTLVDVRTLSPSQFASVPTIERARALIRRTHLIHMPIWQPDVGLARLFHEHHAVMVIGLSDLLPLPPAELAKRLAHTAHMAKMVRHFGGSVRLASLAKTPLELKNELELACIGERLGLSARLALWAIRENPNQ